MRLTEWLADRRETLDATVPLVYNERKTWLSLFSRARRPRRQEHRRM